MRFQFSVVLTLAEMQRLKIYAERFIRKFDLECEDTAVAAALMAGVDAMNQKLDKWNCQKGAHDKSQIQRRD